MQVIDQDPICRKFDFSSVITQQDNDEACKIIESIIANGNYFTNSPKFQTKENIFGRPEEVWLKYRMTFLTSVFSYIGREAKVANMSAPNPNGEGGSLNEEKLLELIKKQKEILKQRLALQKQIKFII